MIRRVLKDIRETWPYWSVLILVGFLVAVYRWQYLTKMSVALLRMEVGIDWFSAYMISANYVGFLMIAAPLFGSEFKHHTMARLLAQPISRCRVWWEKTLAFFMIAAMVLVCQGIAWGWIPWKLANMYPHYPWLLLDHLSKLLVWILLGFCVSAIAMATGFFTSLLLRQSHTAFWAALILLPVALLVWQFLDRILLFSILHFSLTDWIMTHSPSLFGSADGVFLLAFGVLWFCVIYPLGWLKFKNLEV